MFIRTVDDGLTQLLRADIPLRPEDVDIDFAVPTSSWSARIAKPTVNLFLYDVSPSDRPIPTPSRRMDDDGRGMRRRALPIVDLNYLVSVCADDPRTEHDILGRLASRLAGESVIPAAYLPADLDSAVILVFGGNANTRTADLWRTIDGGARSSFCLTAVAAADSYDWVEEAAPVTHVVHSFSRTGE